MKRPKNTEVSIKSKANHHKTYLKTYKAALYAAALYAAAAGDRGHFEA